MLVAMFVRSPRTHCRVPAPHAISDSPAVVDGCGCSGRTSWTDRPGWSGHSGCRTCRSLRADWAGNGARGTDRTGLAGGALRAGDDASCARCPGGALRSRYAARRACWSLRTNIPGQPGHADRTGRSSRSDIAHDALRPDGTGGSDRADGADRSWHIGRRTHWTGNTHRTGRPSDHARRALRARAGHNNNRHRRADHHDSRDDLTDDHDSVGHGATSLVTSGEMLTLPCTRRTTSAGSAE